MKISELLVPEVMILDLKAKTKQAAFEEMINRLYEAGRITDKKVFLEGILARESQTTTGLG
ncbi:PTS transporter subunit EIIA, partial [Pseudomonas stutzeri]|nr:PTS transporter subunit EIIA [Stutzerimonas stutzeri]